MSEETRHNSRILNRALPIFIAAGLGLSLGVTPVVSPIPAFADDGAATEKAAETGTATVYDCTGLDTVATLGLTEGADSSYFKVESFEEPRFYNKKPAYYIVYPSIVEAPDWSGGIKDYTTEVASFDDLISGNAKLPGGNASINGSVVPAESVALQPVFYN